MTETESPQRPSRLKTALKIVLATIWTIVLVWFLLEVFMRVGFDALPPETQAVIQHVRVVPWDNEHLIPVMPFTGSIEYHARIPPNLHDYKVHWGDTQFTFDTINLWDRAEGFRTNEPEWPMDMVAVGDSFTFCWTDFEDCWVQQLHHDYGWHVMDLGVPGTGSVAHGNIMRDYAPPMEPAVVVWQWFGNDYKDDYDFALLRGDTAQLAVPDVAPAAVPDYGTFAEYSAVYRYVRDWIEKKINPPADEADLILTINGREVAVNDSQLSHDLAYEATAFGFAETIRAFEQAHTVLANAGHGTELVIVLIPTKEEVYAAYLTDTLDADYIAMLAAGRAALWAVCVEKGWHCVDPTEEFIAAVEDGQTVYNALDFHLDAVGNQILTDKLGAYLIDEGLLEPRQ
ncbi:MAG: SGNH/GDSL hydrolase family protein [Anaerolineae bacterium]|nr:SGNH/GDSL hydrolase family protein [Anaerolineae bacterium]